MNTAAAFRSELPASRAIAALAYRDLRSWRNRLRVLLESRWRALAYLPVLAFSGAGIAGRLLNRSGSHALLPIPHGWIAAAATFVPAGVFMATGGAMAAAVRRGSPLFQANSPDPYLMSGSAMSPRTVVLWLLVTRSRLVRLGLTALLVILFLPSTFGVGGGLGVAWATIGRVMAMLAAAMSLPVFLLSRRLPSLPLRQLAYGVMGVGMLSAAASGLVALHAGGRFAVTARSWLLAIPPGSFAYDAVTGHLVGLAALGAVVVAFALVTWWLAADCYPELFMATLAHLQLAARRSGNAAVSLRSGVATSQDGWVPAREWVLLWRWWVLERRLSPRTRVLIYAAVIAVGGVAGWLLQTGPGWLSIAAAIMFAMLASSSGLSPAGQLHPMFDLRTPMWHLVAAPLQNRLRVLTLTNSLSIWSYMAVLLLASGLARPALLPALVAGALSLAGFLWLRQSFEMMFAVFLPDPSVTSARTWIFPLVTVSGLATGMVVFISLASSFGAIALLLPLVLLLPAGFAVTGITARILSGNEVAVVLAAGR